MSLSSRQIEARTTGEQRETIKFLNQNHIIAIIVFTLILVSANLWAEAAISVISIVFRLPRNQIKLWMWLVSCLFFTAMIYIIIRYIVRVPITSSFTL